MSIFKSCDVRGVVGQEWDEPDARQIGRSLGRMLRHRQQSRIVVGGDYRRSTPRLKQALTAGLQQAGIQVCDVGRAPTPVVHFAARHCGCPNVAIVTASHNPGRYNGIKFLVNGQPPVPALMAELRAATPQDSADVACTSVTQFDATAEYRRWVIARSTWLAQSCRAALSAHEPPEMASVDASRPQQVVVDAMGGAFSGLATSILATAGYQVTAVGDQLDPDFAERDPNPSVDANLSRLVDAVRRHGADVGLALDGDGDRVIFVDEEGTVARPEQIAAILVQQAFGRCTLVYDLKCASLVPRAVAAQHGRSIMQPSGHGFIRTAMREHGAELGVEVSGHHFFGELDGGDDGLFTALFLLQLLHATRSRLAPWLRAIGWPAITPDLRIPRSGDVAALLDRIAGTCGGRVERLDGVRADYDDGGWGLARASITEPAITFRFEGRDPEHLRAVMARFLRDLPDLKQQVEEHLS